MSLLQIASLDFETANHSAASICAVGVSLFSNGELTKTHHWLVRPPKGHGWFREDFTQIHGLTHSDVRDAEEFPAIASMLLPLLTSADLVIAHNAAFDINVLRTALHYFNMESPGFPCLCTCKAARKIWPDLANHRLNTVAARIGHHFKHHHAGEDAEAAGHILLAMIQESGEHWLPELTRFESFFYQQKLSETIS